VPRSDAGVGGVIERRDDHRLARVKDATGGRLDFISVAGGQVLRQLAGRSAWSSVLGGPLLVENAPDHQTGQRIIEGACE